MLRLLYPSLRDAPLDTELNSCHALLGINRCKDEIYLKPTRICSTVKSINDCVNGTQNYHIQCVRLEINGFLVLVIGAVGCLVNDKK